MQIWCRDAIHGVRLGVRSWLQILLIASLLLSVYPLARLSAAPNDVNWLLTQINCLRQSKGIGPLTLDPALSTSATQHSAFLSAHNVADPHEEPDGSTPLTRAQAAGFKGWVGENVSGGPTAEKAFNWWLGDAIHYQNMTSAYWSAVGIGVANGSNGTWYTLDFGTHARKANRIPAAACGSFAPSGGSTPVPASGTSSGTSAASNTTSTPGLTIGNDAQGNITYQIQDGDTLGQIALVFGYTWADIPKLLSLNHMTEDDFRKLKVGATFLIPARNGTYTPIPSQMPSPTPSATPQSATQPIASLVTARSSVTITVGSPITPSAVPIDSIDASRATSTLVASGNSALSPIPTLIMIALNPTNIPVTPTPISPSPAASDDPLRTLIPLAIALNGVIILGMAINALARRQR